MTYRSGTHAFLFCTSSGVPAKQARLMQISLRLVPNCFLQAELQLST